MDSRHMKMFPIKKLETMPSVIQSIQFDKTIWTIPQIETWLRFHSFQRIKPIREYNHYYRVRLLDPYQFIRLRNKSIRDEGIIFTFGYYE